MSAGIPPGAFRQAGASVTHRVAAALTGKEGRGQQQRENPVRPFDRAAAMGISAEQLADYIAACEGKITWTQYFRKWKNSPNLGLG